MSRYVFALPPLVTTDSIVVTCLIDHMFMCRWHFDEAWRVDGVERVLRASRAPAGVSISARSGCPLDGVEVGSRRPIRHRRDAAAREPRIDQLAMSILNPTPS